MKRLFILCLIFASCNPANRVLRNQEQFEKVGQKWLEKNPCVNDSIAIYIPGKRDSVYIEIPTGISGDDHLSVIDLLDSVREAASHIDRACQPRVAAAYRKGYQTAIGRVKMIRVPIAVHDTIRVVVKDKQYAAVLEQNLKQAKNELVEAQRGQIKAQAQRNLWLILFLFAMLILTYLLRHKMHER